MCDSMKNVSRAQTLILFKGFTSNKNNLCPVLSQCITAGDMLETADVPCLAINWGIIVRRWCKGWLITVGRFVQGTAARCKYGLFRLQSSLDLSSWSKRRVCGMSRCVLHRLHTYRFLSLLQTMPCGHTCWDRPQVIATFVGWGWKCKVGMGAVSLVCQPCGEGGGDSVSTPHALVEQVCFFLKKSIWLVVANSG